MLEIKEKGIFQVVEDAGQLQNWSSAGWRLVAVLEKEIPYPVTESIQIQGMQLATYGAQQPYTQSTKYLTHKVQSFLLVHEEDSVLAKMKADLDAAHTRLGQETKDFDDFKKQAALDLKALELAKRYVAEVGDAHTRLKEEFEAYKARVEAELKEATLVIKMYSTMRKTAYERILEGEFDERVEGIEAGDFGDGRDPVAGVPEAAGVHTE